MNIKLFTTYYGDIQKAEVPTKKELVFNNKIEIINDKTIIYRNYALDDKQIKNPNYKIKEKQLKKINLMGDNEEDFLLEFVINDKDFENYIFSGKEKIFPFIETKIFNRTIFIIKQYFMSVYPKNELKIIEPLKNFRKGMNSIENYSKLISSVFKTFYFKENLRENLFNDNLLNKIIEIKRTIKEYEIVSKKEDPIHNIFNKIYYEELLTNLNFELFELLKRKT